MSNTFIYYNVGDGAQHGGTPGYLLYRVVDRVSRRRMSVQRTSNGWIAWPGWLGWRASDALGLPNITRRTRQEACWAMTRHLDGDPNWQDWKSLSRTD